MGQEPVIHAERTGERIAALRKRKGLSVAGLQEKMGLAAAQTVYQWEKGKTLPSVDNLVILADVLGVAVDEILVTENRG